MEGAAGKVSAPELLEFREWCFSQTTKAACETGSNEIIGALAWDSTNVWIRTTNKNHKHVQRNLGDMNNKTNTVYVVLADDDIITMAQKISQEDLDYLHEHQQQVINAFEKWRRNRNPVPNPRDPR